jgi:replicative DNA helicase
MVKTLHSKEFISEWRDLQNKRKANPEKYRPRSTGVKALDKILGGGIEYGTVTIYGGAQKVGKSTLLSHTAKTFGYAGDPFGYFSLEMTNTATATRLLCDISGVEKDRIRRIEWTDSEWVQLDASAKTVEDFDAWWTYGASTVAEIKKVLQDVYDSTRIRVNAIFVDYMQLMSHPGKALRQEELGAISRSFKRMSVELGEPMLIILAAQVNREAAKSSIVSANTFLGTGAIERDMDIGIIIHTVNDDEGTVRNDIRQLTVVGSRETDVGSVPVRFNGRTSSIRDMSATGMEITRDFWRKQSQEYASWQDF